MRLSAALLALFLVAGCDSADDADASVFLRVENASAVNFSSVSVEFDGEETTYGAVRAGRASEYRAFEIAYRFGTVAVQAENGGHGLRTLSPIGEEPLAPGRYTYRLDVDGAELRLEFEQD